MGTFHDVLSSKKKKNYHTTVYMYKRHHCKKTDLFVKLSLWIIVLKKNDESTLYIVKQYTNRASLFPFKLPIISCPNYP